MAGKALVELARARTEQDTLFREINALQIGLRRTTASAVAAAAGDSKASAAPKAQPLDALQALYRDAFAAAVKEVSGASDALERVRALLHKREAAGAAATAAGAKKTGKRAGSTAGGADAYGDAKQKPTKKSKKSYALTPTRTLPLTPALIPPRSVISDV